MTKAKPSPPLKQFFGLCAPWILIVAVSIAYHATLSVPFLFDDIASIQQNPTLDGFWQSLLPPANSGTTVSGRPLLNLSFAISTWLGGGDLTGHHLGNIAIHCANTCLLYALTLGTLRVRTDAEGALKSPALIALLVALLWSLHPLQTESVTYLSQRAESLVAFFYLLTLYLFLRAQTAPPRYSSLLLIAAVLSCALGMGAKEVMVSAPIIVLLYDRAFFSRTLATAWKTRKPFYLGLFLTWSVLILCVLQSGSRGNTAGFRSGTNWLEYLYTQAFALTHYLRLVFWPSPLVFDYGRDLVTSFTEIAWRAGLLVIAIAWVLKRCRDNKPSGFLGMFLFAVLAPTALVPVATQTIAEHRTYLALAPLLVGVVVFLTHLIGEKFVCILASALSLALTVATIDRNRDYRSVESLWADTLAKRPNNDRVWYSMGCVYLEKNLTDKAKDAFQQAIRLRSDPINVLGYAHALTQSGAADEAIRLYREIIPKTPPTYSEVYTSMANLGLLLGQKKQHEEAIRWLTEAIALNPRKTGAPYNLGSLYFSLGRYEEALQTLPQAFSDPEQGEQAKSVFVRALLALGKSGDALAFATRQKAESPSSHLLRLTYAQSLAATGRLADATTEYLAILAEDPAVPSAHTQLGIVYLAARRLPEAKSHLLAAVAQDSSDVSAQTTLAEVLLKSNEPEEAVPHYEAALRLAPNAHQTRYVLANTLLQLGELDKAIPQYELLIKAGAPPLAEIHNELAIIYAQKGNYAQARAHFAECLRLNPKHSGASENIRRLE